VPDAEVGALADVDGLDEIELGCGTGYVFGVARRARGATVGWTTRRSRSAPHVGSRPNSTSASR
jgi:hypothetical protein